MHGAALFINSLEKLQQLSRLLVTESQGAAHVRHTHFRVRTTVMPGHIRPGLQLACCEHGDRKDGCK